MLQQFSSKYDGIPISLITLLDFDKAGIDIFVGLLEYCGGVVSQNTLRWLAKARYGKPDQFVELRNAWNSTSVKWVEFGTK